MNCELCSKPAACALIVNAVWEVEDVAGLEWIWACVECAKLDLLSVLREQASQTA